MKSYLSPGDICTLTIAVRSLHDTYPGEYQTDARTSVPALWQFNPFITPLQDSDEAETIDMHYPSIHQSNTRPVAFCEGYTTYLGEQLGIPLRATINRPDLYLSDEERQQVSQIEEITGKPARFALVDAGCKRDYTAKQLPIETVQDIIDATRGRIQWVQVGSREHDHPRLYGCIDLRGKTDARQIIRLAYHCSLGMGSVTYLQHLCAAWECPYICWLGGREPAQWVQYPLQHTLSALGQLPCCRSSACWKSRVVALNDGSEKDKSLCEMPVLGLQRPVAACLARITAHEVLAVVDRLM